MILSTANDQSIIRLTKILNSHNILSLDKALQIARRTRPFYLAAVWMELLNRRMDSAVKEVRPLIPHSSSSFQHDQNLDDSSDRPTQAQ